MPGGSSLSVPKNSPLHAFLLARLKERVDFSKRKQSQFIRVWQDAEERALAYMPELEYDALRRSDRERGQPKYTTIQIPYSYALLSTAHTYVSTVFLGRSPVHQYSGRHGETEQQTQALEALIGYQIEVGGLVGPYYIWFYDILKYGVGILGTYWCVEDIQYSYIEELTDEYGVSSKNRVTVREPGYEGNKVYNVSPFDFLHDPHFPIGRFQEGEFCAVHKVSGWTEIIKRKAQGYYMNCEFIPKSTGGSSAATGVAQGAAALQRPEQPGTFVAETLGEEGKTHPHSVGLWEVYVDLIQKEWRLGESDYPEKWVFSVTDDFSVIIGAQPLGSAHGKFPFSIGEAEIEGYGVFGRGIPEIALPVQNTMDWLVNTHFYNVRAALNNQFLIDPSKVIVTDAEDAGPGFIYRLRPEAYGSDVRSFFHQVPVADVTQNHFGDTHQMMSLGERVLGISDAMFGALSSGGRKTATEVRTSTGFGVNRWKTVAEYLSTTAFSPHSQMLVQHSQQYYTNEKKFRLVGDLASSAGPQFFDVTKQDIGGFYDFVAVDGTLPVDRMALANLWQGIMAQLQRFPALLAQYDVGKIFAYIGNLAGARNINQFKIQVVPDGMLQMQLQQGNVVPMKQPGMSPQGGGAPAPTPPQPQIEQGEALNGPEAA